MVAAYFKIEPKKEEKIIKVETDDDIKAIVAMFNSR